MDIESGQYHMVQNPSSSNLISFGTNNDLGMLDKSLVTHGQSKKPRAQVVLPSANIVQDHSISTTPVR